MGTPDFEHLTSAEKLNDPKYRELVYRTYPNEPTCACPTNASPRHPQPCSSCRSICSACDRRRDNNPRRRSSGQFMSTHCTAKNDAGSVRLRGGGGDNEFLGSDADFVWHNSRFRLEGGALQQQQPVQIYPSVGCGKAPGRQRISNFQNSFDNNFLRVDELNPEYLARNKCKLKHIEEKNHSKPMCSCPAKDDLESVLKKKGQAVCIKKPCMGTDCLIKAFKDAQEFVDSIGKVPGLAGLGITESPYFGRPQESKEIKKSESKPVPSSKQPDATSNLCNTQNLENLRKMSYNPASNVHTSNVPKKLGVVQEALTFPDPSTFSSFKSKKKEEKLEKSKEAEVSSSPPQISENTPCGEPKCKSRPKKVSTEITNSAEKIQVTEKSSNSQKTDKKHSSRLRSHSSPSGDRISKSKKTNQFDFSYGNAYPTSVYGHKNCNLLRPRVPPHMGWMWNQTDPVTKIKPRTGWRPGAISVALKELLKEAKEGFFKEAKRPMSLPRLGGKKGKVQKTMSYSGMKKNACEDEAEEEIEYPPTLHVHRKDGVYYVTMYPIRQERSDEPRLDEPMNPLQFKIVKSKDSLATSSTASDMEIEFSPPAAVNRLRKKPNVIHIETQVKQQEILDAFKRPSSGKKKQKESKAKNNKEKKK